MLSKTLGSVVRGSSRRWQLPSVAVASAALAPRESRRVSTVSAPEKMTNSEAFVEQLRAMKVETVFGIVGSAFMDALDLFPAAGIRFVSVQHEQNSAHMADGYARITGQHGVVVGQNG